MICGCEHYESGKSAKLINSDGGDGRINVCAVLSEKHDSVSSRSSLSPYLGLSVMSGAPSGERLHCCCSARIYTSHGPHGQSQELGNVPSE